MWTPFNAFDILLWTAYTIQIPPLPLILHVIARSHARCTSPFVAKLMGLFFDMDTLVGKDFEAGLANLKATAEK
ncbi:hypothetical protein BH10PSE18_BH10PSE18_05950 [soil metagenome]